MNITLFGSAFNPPHLGHALVIQDFLEAGICDELWLLPTFSSSFGKELLSAEIRLEMCRLFISDLPKELQQKIKICPIEIDYELNGQTYKTIELMKTNTEYIQKTMNIPVDKILDIKYHFLMGSDQLSKFELWGNWLQLLKQMQFYVYPRVGYPLENLKPEMKTFTHENQILTNISSTLIKQKIETGKSLELLLTPKVYKFVTSNNLY